MIDFLSDIPILPQSVAMISELEVVQGGKEHMRDYSTAK
jgi:hypothetical protein